MIMYFLCSSQGEEIRVQQTTAKPDTTHPMWGESGGVVGVKVTVGEDLYLNVLCFTAFKTSFSSAACGDFGKLRKRKQIFEFSFLF